MSDYISEDVLGVILKRLSVKTLIRCRCVCKSWKQLIASKCFILDHLALQKPRFLVKHKKFDYDAFDPQTFVLENFRGPPQIEEEDREKFAALELPDEMERRYADRILIKWQDSLSVAEFQFACCTHPTNYVDLWVMQSGVLWSKMFRIQFAPAPTLYFNCMLESPDGRVLVSAEIEDLRAYHPKPRDGYLSDFALLRSNFIYTLNSYHVYDFVESLVFPDPKCISSDD